MRMLAAGAWLGGAVAAAAVVAVLGAFVLTARDSRPASRPQVVATTSIIGDWVKNVAGGDVDLTTLVGPDGDPHEYEPVPADSITLARASLIFENGLGLEHWLDKLCTSSESKATRVVLSQGIVVRHVPGSEGLRANGHDDDRDPHAWQDVRDAAAMVGNIRDALVKADPAHAQAYTARAAAYIAGLDALDAKIMRDIHSIPAARRKLVTSHDAFGYFGRRYGMEISRGALESVTTEAADPSARQIADVVDQIRASGVPVIFVENIQNPKLIDRIAAEAGVKVGPPLYSDALGKPGTEGDSYLHMMSYNARVLTRALEP